MSAQDNNDSLVIDEDYQIIDASSFQSSTQEEGLQFHVNLPCPICTSFKSNFICERCIRCGCFTHSRGVIHESYSELGSKLLDINQKIRSISEHLVKRYRHPKQTARAPVEEIKILVASLNNAVAFHTKENQSRRKKLEEIRQRLMRCHTDSQEWLKRRTRVLKSLSSLHRQRLDRLQELETYSEKIESIRAKYLRELLHAHLVVDLSPNVSSPDTFAGSGLHLDRENIFIGPEPLLSSHTALTYCVPAIRAAAHITDLWIPPTIQQHLQLTGSFLTGLPQRDNLGRVYSAVLHAVHMICSCRSVDIRSVLERAGITLPLNHSIYNPLIGLFCLALFTQTREYDAPYNNVLDGFFGNVSPPASYFTTASPRLRLEHVEPGEEVKEMESSSSEDHQSKELHSPSHNVRTTDESTQGVDNELDLWELIADESRFSGT